MPKDPNSSGGFWKTVPGILTAVASLLTALGGFILIISQVGVCNRSADNNRIAVAKPGDTNAHAASTSAMSNDASRTAMAMSPSAISGGITYTILNIRKTNYSATEDRLTMNINLKASAGSGGMSFASECFRLQLDDLKTAPVAGGSGRYVPEESEWKEDIVFVTPKTINSGTLWVGHVNAGSQSPIQLRW